MNNNLYFALDVGTRTVIGLVLEKRQNKYHILAAVIEEHSNRAMLDGQIHDIPSVIAIIKKVKTKLENKLKIKLNEVSIAAAGRALYTQKATVSKEIPTNNKTINEDMIYSLIMAGVQEALKKINSHKNNNDNNNYYCVGYSVIKYYLDSVEIKNLLGQRGNEMQVEVVATFLPRVVVDSLNTVINEAGLKINNMTLEPIAASNVVITEGMRKLNIALVDIGAGTSDIAISLNGAVSAYGMVPSAGDEITEAISEKLLVDFETAELIKRNLHNNTVSYTDIMGMEIIQKSSEIVAKIDSDINNLSDKIANEIITLNGKSPQAVILIGGGSLTPLLPEKLYKKLELTPERVAVRGREVLKYVTGATKLLSGPMSITPIGIALTEANNLRSSFEFIKLNGDTFRIFGRDKLKIVDALLAAGIKNNEIFPRPGKGMTLEINGEVKIIQGEPGIPASITINGQKGNLDSLVSKGDEIEFVAAKQGKDAKFLLKDLILEQEKIIFLNGKKRYLKPVVYINGIEGNRNTVVTDKAIIEIKECKTIEETLARFKISQENFEYVLLNGNKADLKSYIKNGDCIETITKSNSTQVIEVTVNGEKISLEKRDRTILLDIFKKINFSATPPMGKKNLELKINGEKASYTSKIKQGDDIVIYWV